VKSPGRHIARPLKARSQRGNAFAAFDMKPRMAPDNQPTRPATNKHHAAFALSASAPRWYRKIPCRDLMFRNSPSCWPSRLPVGAVVVPAQNPARLWRGCCKSTN
ncbi:MAG: hypothetical protein ACKOLA_09160, partial [Spartobacteria bacterium]